MGRAVTVFKCKSPGACPGARAQSNASATRSEGGCSAGFSGVLCSTCEAGYYPSDGACEKCDDDEQNGLQLAIWAGMVLLGLGVVLGAGYCLARREADEQVASSDPEHEARRGEGVRG